MCKIDGAVNGFVLLTRYRVLLVVVRPVLSSACC